MSVTVLDFPSLNFASADFGLVSNTTSFTSPLSGTTQTLELPGAHWRGVLDYPPLNDADKRTLQVFLLKLRGAAGRFYFNDPIWKAAGGNDGAGTGTPLVNGGSQIGTSLSVDGFAASVTGILKSGDYFSFDTTLGRELKMLTADVDSDGSGNATLTFEPPIRNAPADNAAIEVSNPTTIFRLANDEQVKWAFAGGNIYTGFQLDVVEAFFK